MTLDEHKAKMAAEDEALRREAWALNAPVRDCCAFHRLLDTESAAAIEAADAKERAMLEHGYGGQR